MRRFLYRIPVLGPSAVHLVLVSHQYTPNPMNAQVIGRYPADQFADFDLGGVAGRSPRPGDERQSLLAQIGSARRRIVAARCELASVQDPALWCVRVAQRVLAEERESTIRMVEAIASEADGEVGRILGRVGARSRPSRHARAQGQPARVAADVPWLRAELDRLCTKAEALEREARRRVDSPSALAPPAGLALLEEMVANAVAVTRRRHDRDRASAVQEAEQRLASAREEADRAASEAPGTDWSGPVPVAVAEPSTELALRPTTDAENPGPSPAAWRGEAEPKAPRSKPMVLDVVLPLIAVVIVLLVVLSWIG